MGSVNSNAGFAPVFANPEARDGRAFFFPSIGEYPVYDSLAYDAMMADAPRVQAFTAALEAYVHSESVVVELGCGALAPWACMAARLGAARVIAVESLDEARKQASNIVATEGLQDRIEVVSPDEYSKISIKKDLIIAEIIGTIGSSEGAEKTINKELQGPIKDSVILLPEAWETQVRLYSWRRFCKGEFPAFVPAAENYLIALRKLGILQPRL